MQGYRTVNLCKLADQCRSWLTQMLNLKVLFSSIISNYLDSQVSAFQGLTNRAHPASHATSCLHITGKSFFQSTLGDRRICFSLAFLMQNPKRYDRPSRSLKLLPILGLPSLPSLPLPGLLPASSAVRLGLNGPGFPLCLFGASTLFVTGAVTEDVLESDVCEIPGFL